MRRSAGALLLSAGLFGLLSLTACSHSPQIEVSAKFVDVGSLTTHAPVMMDDIRVGEVTNIRLDGNLALVTMSLDPSARVPNDVTAQVRRTSLLGEQIVDLAVPTGAPDTAPALRNGAIIDHTQIRADLQDLVQSGNAVLAPIAASEVATLVDEGARGFGGQGATLRGLLDNFGQVIHAYAGRTTDIHSLITSLNQLNTTLAAHAAAQGQSLGNTQRALALLRVEGARLQTAVHALARLAVGARGILAAHADEMSHFFQQMRSILGVLQQEQGSIVQLLQYAPLHNRNTQLVEFQTMNQVLQDFVICGLNNDQSDPARRCVGNP